MGYDGVRYRGEGVGLPPQFLEKINEFVKFTIDFLNNFDALDPPPSFKPVADSMRRSTTY